MQLNLENIIEQVIAQLTAGVIIGIFIMIKKYYTKKDA